MRKRHVRRRTKPTCIAPEPPETPVLCYSPEELIARECDQREADVVDKWWYRDRYEAGVLLRYRLQGNECDVVLQTTSSEGVWVPGWPATAKVPLYRVYEGLGVSPVFVVADEYAADAAIAMGLSAVTSAGGAEDVERTDWRPLAGRDVIVSANGERSRAYARAAARMVLRLEPAATVRMVELPGLEEGQDIADFGWDLGLSPEALADRVRELARRAPVMKMPDTLGWPNLNPMPGATPLRWLWPGRVPIGKPVAIFGGCDHGKSLFAIDLAARVSVGADWPDGRGKAPRGKVILMSREDHLNDTIRPRLDRAGADPDAIISLEWVTRVIDGKERRRRITLRDLADLERAIEIAGNVRLIVIDPLSAYFGMDMPSRRLIRPAIDGLSDIADRHGLGVVITAEMGGRDGLGYGANMALTSVVRTAWMLAPEPENRRLLLPIKATLADPGGGLACQITLDAVAWEAAPVLGHADGRLIGAATSLPEVKLPVDSLPVVSNASTRLYGARPGPKPLTRQSAAEWLQKQLGGGPVPVGSSAKTPGTLRAAAASEGFTWITVCRAFAELHGVSARSEETGKRTWVLPAPAPESNADPDAAAHDKA